MYIFLFLRENKLMREKQIDYKYALIDKIYKYDRKVIKKIFYAKNNK